MYRHLIARPLSFLFAFSVVLLSPVLAEDWKQVLKQSGTIRDSTVGGGRAKSPSITSPPYGFVATGKMIRVHWDTEVAGRGADFRIEIEKLIPLNNGGVRWQRVMVLGRTHATTKGAQALNSGAGSYRLFIIGHSMKYNVTVETLDPDAK